MLNCKHGIHLNTICALCDKEDLDEELRIENNQPIRAVPSDPSTWQTYKEFQNEKG